MKEDKLEITHLMGKKLDKPIIMKWKSEIKKNKMDEVAKLFGKKLGEEFIVNEEECRKNLICKMTERGLFFYHSSYKAWWQDSGLLSELITGKAVIINE